MIYQELGNYEAALNDFNNAINIDDGIALFHLNKGNLLIKMNQFEEGLSELKIAEKLNLSGDTSKYNRVIPLSLLQTRQRTILNFQSM